MPIANGKLLYGRVSLCGENENRIDLTHTPACLFQTCFKHDLCCSTYKRTVTLNV